VNVTNTAVNVTRVTNVYNTVVINRNASGVTYANRSVNGGVTVVSRDTFVNARPVARNVVSVPARELAAAPVSRGAAFEPVRSSVIGAGVAAAHTPPAAVAIRPVVALRTPAPMPRSFDQRQAQAGGHLNPQAAEPLVRQQPPVTRTVPAAQPQRQAQGGATSEEGFRPFTPPGGGSTQTKATRVWEAQGTPEPERNPTPETPNGNGRASNGSRSQANTQASSEQWSHPLAKPVAPVRRDEQQQQQRDQEQKYSSWHQQQKPASSSASQHQQSASSSSSTKKAR